MARKPKTTSVEDQEVDIFLDKARDALVEKIMSVPGIKGIAFETASMFTTAVKLPDGKYKQKPVDSGAGFTLSGMRMGKRGYFIFEFQPIDPSEFTQMELDETKVFAALPGFEKMIVEAMDLVAAPKTAGEHFGENAYLWPDGSEHWLKGKRREFRAAHEAERAQKAKEDADARVEAAAGYAENPQYGSW